MKEKYFLILTRTVHEILQVWTEERGLSITELNTAIELRENIITMLSIIGLNPYENFDKSWTFVKNDINEVAPNLLDYIRGIKQCIFEGYKLNIAVWNAVEKKYFTRKSHLPIIIPSGAASGTIQDFTNVTKYGDTNPKYIIYNKILCKPSQIGITYQIEADAISVIDGFIPLDVNFDALV
jgi:hypothetical protein